MIENPAVVFAELSASQVIAFVSFAAFTIGFFVWVAWLTRK